MTSSVVIYSGGVDSFTLLNHVKVSDQPDSPAVLSFDYGQRHKKELIFATKACVELGLVHTVVDLTSINKLLGGSALTSDIAVPEGHYAEDSMKQTVVPNRNMIMLSIATGYAVSLGVKDVYYAAHKGDHDIYPDCRPQFVTAMNGVTMIANYTPVYIRAPFINFTKKQIVEMGQRLELDYSKTWSCYKGGKKHCGVCGTCVERREAFVLNGLTDPVDYNVPWETTERLLQNKPNPHTKRR